MGYQVPEAEHRSQGLRPRGVDPRTCAEDHPGYHLRAVHDRGCGVCRGTGCGFCVCAWRLLLLKGRIGSESCTTVPGCFGHWENILAYGAFFRIVRRTVWIICACFFWGGRGVVQCSEYCGLSGLVMGRGCNTNGWAIMTERPGGDSAQGKLYGVCLDFSHSPWHREFIGLAKWRMSSVPRSSYVDHTAGVALGSTALCDQVFFSLLYLAVSVDYALHTTAVARRIVCKQIRMCLTKPVGLIS